MRPAEAVQFAVRVRATPAPDWRSPSCPQRPPQVWMTPMRRSHRERSTGDDGVCPGVALGKRCDDPNGAMPEATTPRPHRCRSRRNVCHSHRLSRRGSIGTGPKADKGMCSRLPLGGRGRSWGVRGAFAGRRRPPYTALSFPSFLRGRGSPERAVSGGGVASGGGADPFDAPRTPSGTAAAPLDRESAV
jgi:hypothetical protein